MADLDEIMSGRSDAAPEQTATPEQVEQTSDGGQQQRDDRGRFAPATQQDQHVAAPAAPEQQPQLSPEQRAPDGFIPIQALDARIGKVTERYETQLREQAEHFQRMLLQSQRPQQPQEAPKPPPDWYENPDAAVDYRLQQAIEPVQQNQRQIVDGFSRMMASDKFGEQVVNDALAEFTQRYNANAPGIRFEHQRIMAAPHPYGELVKWHKAQAALSTYGDDPTAYREKLRAEILAEIQGGQAQPSTQQTQQPAAMPTQFTRNSGPSTAPAFSGPRPLSEIMGGR